MSGRLNAAITSFKWGSSTDMGLHLFFTVRNGACLLEALPTSSYYSSQKVRFEKSVRFPAKKEDEDT